MGRVVMLGMCVWRRERWWGRGAEWEVGSVHGIMIGEMDRWSWMGI